MSKMKITIIPFTQTQEEDFKHPSKHYIVNALQENVYFATTDRAKAQLVCDEMYGKGKYKIRVASIGNGGGEISVRGSSNSASRKGTAYINICNKQGRELE